MIDIRYTIDKIQTEMADPEANKLAPIDILLGSNTNEREKVCFPTVFSDMAYILAVDPLLQRFFEMEEISPVCIHTKEQEQCEPFFMQSHRKLDSGRYEVKIPTRFSIEQLGSSRGVLQTKVLRINGGASKVMDYMRPVDRLLAICKF